MTLTKTDLKNLTTKKDFKKLEKRFAGLEERFDGLEERFYGLEERFDGLEERFNGLGKDTKSDIKRLENEILGFKWAMDKKLQTYQERIEKMIGGFKDEIFNLIDPVMKELVTMREEQIVISHQTTTDEEKLEDHEKRIAHLETTS